MAVVMAQVNMLVQYPLSDQMIAMWTATLRRLRPWVTPKRLQATIDAFLTGELEWDKTQGIQNIFYAIVRVKLED